MKSSRSLGWRAACCAGAACVAAALAQPAAAQQPARQQAQPAFARHSPYRPVGLPQRAKVYYQMTRGVDNMRVRHTASDNLIRFSYRVTDPAAAKRLGDKSATPHLYGQTSHALLDIPVMDKIGQLRQSGPLQAGQEYWMVFSNKGNAIKPGERVNVLVGSFHIDGLVVE
ncbi:MULTISPECIES: hypothetical protein [unclassified Burkholderia]|uniref:hypothetical protein n=1 Tax=unclassified Burkholderia TaxID=2613784 RepID=UPI000F57C74C|nr:MULTISPECIES: hypothetical protein [unclassified Burkholderia]RQR27311.1 hypothetical protein DIE22_31045 [Burkholderia sp. Bp9142]RQR45188.1 hypothetical protein DIE21_32040 [Burkholderia sp. Bp9140]